MPVLRTSPVWNMSSDELVVHLSGLTEPDKVYWDSRELKNTKQKFQALDWNHWPKALKANGQWVLKQTQRPVVAETSTVAHRIRCSGVGSPFIALDPTEYHAYLGAGHMLARFEHGVLAETWHPFAHITGEDYAACLLQIQAMTHAWIENAVGEVWFVNCSCHELVNPGRVSLSDAATINQVHRAFSAILFDALNVAEV